MWATDDLLDEIRSFIDYPPGIEPKSSASKYPHSAPKHYDIINISSTYDLLAYNLRFQYSKLLLQNNCTQMHIYKCINLACCLKQI